MADPTFFDLFEALWSENGTTDVITLPQYKAGWTYIGSLPPTVEQFNKVQQLNDQKLAWLYQQVKSVADEMGQPLDADTIDVLLHALQHLDMDKATAGILAVSRGGTGFTSVAQNQFLVGAEDGKYAQRTADEARAILAAPKICSISALPSSDIGPVIVEEFGEVWIWVPAPFSGYRSPNCGAINYFDSLTAPVGYLKANSAAVSRTTYRGLFSILGTRHGAGDGATTFNLPDMRGEFARGWDDGRGVDVARVLGSLQLATSMYFAPNSPSTGGAASTQAQNVDSTANGGSPSVTYSTGGGTPASIFTVRPRNIALLACIKI